jgi:hypothetical protein
LQLQLAFIGDTGERRSGQSSTVAARHCSQTVVRCGPLEEYYLASRVSMRCVRRRICRALVLQLSRQSCGQKDKRNKTAFGSRAVRRGERPGGRSLVTDATNVMRLTLRAVVVRRRAEPSARRAAVGSEARQHPRSSSPCAGSGGARAAASRGGSERIPRWLRIAVVTAGSVRNARTRSWSSQRASEVPAQDQ